MEERLKAAQKEKKTGQENKDLGTNRKKMPSIGLPRKSDFKSPLLGPPAVTPKATSPVEESSAKTDEVLDTADWDDERLEETLRNNKKDQKKQTAARKVGQQQTAPGGKKRSPRKKPRTPTVKKPKKPKTLKEGVSASKKMTGSAGTPQDVKIVGVKGPTEPSKKASIDSNEADGAKKTSLEVEVTESPVVPNASSPVSATEPPSTVDNTVAASSSLSDKVEQKFGNSCC